MKKFRVSVSYEGSVIVEVEARDEDDACEKAERIVESMNNVEFLDELDLQYAETNVIREITIIDWFEIVCDGIRAEYEDGTSHRDLETDKKTLSELLEKL